MDWSGSTYLIAGEVLQGGGGDLVGVSSLQVLQDTAGLNTSEADPEL